MRRIKILVSLLGLLFVIVESSFACTPIVQEMDANSILERIKPLAKVSVSGEDTTVQAAPVETGPQDPEKVYKSYCTICHQSGVAGAPKFRNKADWDPRVAIGIDALVQSAIKGKGGMPPKGTCMQCTEEDIKVTIEYMLPK